ncbi:MAG: efflux RND transporter periplasmic adaptor subunit [Bacteroidetes bacterium]|nr:efflux RND transporter periplasmic adaptor subunit [Bacteroidota bacterium]
MSVKHILISIGAVILLLVVAYFLWPSSAADVPSYRVQRGDFEIYVIESGSVRAKNSVTITAPRIISGGNLQVVSLAPEGTIAKEGDVLARFDPSTALKRIQDKQTELKSAMADLAKLKAQQAADESQAQTEYETAKLNFQLAELAREKMQFEPEARKREAQIEFERARLTFEQAKLNLENKSIVRKSELGNLQLRIEQIRSDIAVSQKDMEELTLRAPISGLIVYENNWATGRKITKGDQPWSGMPIISLPDLTAMEAEVSINEMDISKVERGQSVLIIPDAFPDKTFHGTISSVSQIGRQKGQGSNIKVFDIIVDIKETDEVLKPGITTTTKIIVDQVKNVLSVPIISVFEDGKTTYAYVSDGGSFEKREVTLGQRNDNFVVVASGIREGELVALRNPEMSVEEDAQGEAMRAPGSPSDRTEGNQ